MNRHTSTFRLSLALLSVVGVPASVALLGWPSASQAALVDAGKGPQVLIGRDDDNQSNTIIQPPGVTANQSLNNADVIEGGQGNDVMIGLLGSDVMLGGPGHDIIVGGPDPGGNNSDIMFGGPGDDVNLWAPGDGSEAFIGGPGKDALVFGVTDRVGIIPTLSAPAGNFPFGVPTANVSGQGGFCTIVPAPADSGYDFLVRFIVRASGAQAVTVRVRDVEQLFCTSTAGGSITFADLTQPDPVQTIVTIGEVEALNTTVGFMIR